MSREEKAARKAIKEWNKETASEPPTKKTVGGEQSEQVRILSHYIQLSLFDERSGSDERPRVTRHQGQS